MEINNTNDRYGVIAITFHWVMAIIVIGMIILGLYMAGLPVSPKKLKFFRWHKETGLLVLFLAILRVAWRMSQLSPGFLPALPAWQKLAARSVHFLLYTILLVMPVTGWLMSSASGLSVSFFGLFHMPDLVPKSEGLRDIFLEVHESLAFILIALITIHVAAVVQHYVIYKENILRRMWPW